MRIVSRTRRDLPAGAEIPTLALPSLVRLDGGRRDSPYQAASAMPRPGVSIGAAVALMAATVAVAALTVASAYTTREQLMALDMRLNTRLDAREVAVRPSEEPSVSATSRAGRLSVRVVGGPGGRVLPALLATANGTVGLRLVGTGTEYGAQLPDRTPPGDGVVVVALGGRPYLAAVTEDVDESALLR